MSDLPTTLDGITALTDAATPGPWSSMAAEEWRGDATVLESHGAYLGESLAGHAALYDPEDAAFIAHARTLVPRLVEALRWVVEEGVFYEGDTTEIRPTIDRILAGGQP